MGSTHSNARGGYDKPAPRLQGILEFKLPTAIDESRMEVVAILDGSGSMRDLTMDTIGGFNAYLEELKKSEKRVSLTLIVFNTVSTVVHAHKDVREVPPLTQAEYAPQECTALIDALGTGIDDMRRHISQMEARPGQVSFFVTTDGLENSSRRYLQENVKKMVVQCTEDYKWDFIFAGANIDAFGAGQSLGFQAENIANIHNDGRGQEAIYKAVGCAQMSAPLERKKCSMQEAYNRNVK